MSDLFTELLMGLGMVIFSLFIFFLASRSKERFGNRPFWYMVIILFMGIYFVFKSIILGLIGLFQ